MSAPWWSDGLAFECQRCRSCCRGEPGYVWVDDAEVAALAAHFGRPEGEFRAKQCRSVYGRTSLRERPDGDCVLLGPEGCTAYEARPTQCRTFPFWAEHLRSPAAWARLARQCPGLNRGALHGPEDIRGRLENG